MTPRHRVIDSELAGETDRGKQEESSRKAECLKETSTDAANELKSVIQSDETKQPYCYFCHGTEDVICCKGGCNRAYHLRCIGMKASSKYDNWKCKQCRGSELKSSDFHKKHCLKQWYLKSTVATGPNEKSLILEGIRCFDNTVWKCSPIAFLLDSTHFQTINSTIYILIGECDVKKSVENGFEESVSQAFARGVPDNWRELIGGFSPASSEASPDKQSMEGTPDKQSKESTPEKRKGVATTQREGVSEGVKEGVAMSQKEGVASKQRKRVASRQKGRSEQTNKEGTTEQKETTAPKPKQASKPKKERKPRSEASVPSVRVIPLDSVPEDPLPVTEPNSDTTAFPAVRRSSRIRMPPLAFWKNEYLRENVKTGKTELIVGSSNADIPSVVSRVIPAEEHSTLYEIDSSFLEESELLDEEEVESSEQTVRKKASRSGKEKSGREPKAKVSDATKRAKKASDGTKRMKRVSEGVKQPKKASEGTKRPKKASEGATKKAKPEEKTQKKEAEPLPELHV